MFRPDYMPQSRMPRRFNRPLMTPGRLMKALRQRVRYATLADAAQAFGRIAVSTNDPKILTDLKGTEKLKKLVALRRTWEFLLKRLLKLPAVAYVDFAKTHVITPEGANYPVDFYALSDPETSIREVRKYVG